MSGLIKFLFRYLGSNASRWVLTTVGALLFRSVSKLFQKKELVDLSKSKPGDKFVIEHLDVTHSDQIKQTKAAKKAAKKARKR